MTDDTEPGREMTDTSEVTPRRIQRQRTRGWRMPDKRHAKYVGRPTIWGNPFKGPDAVERYREALDNLGQEQLDQLLAPLAGLHLLCWCPLDRECHADILLAYANFEK